MNQVPTIVDVSGTGRRRSLSNLDDFTVLSRAVGRTLTSAFQPASTISADLQSGHRHHGYDAALATLRGDLHLDLCTDYPQN
jgi:hypothetical protein